MSIDQWSATPTSNDMPNYFQTGMRPSSVKTAGWDVMADLKSYIVALPVAGGTANALTVANGRPLGALTAGLQQWLVPAATNTGPATFAPDGLVAANVFANGAALLGGELQPNVPASLKYDGTQWNLQNPVGVSAAASRNFFVDPCCRVAQGAIATLSTVYTYGATDLVQCKATGTAVSAGTITQDTAGTAGGATAYSCKIAGATITGTGKVFFRRWIESRDAVALKNQTATFSVNVFQDTGSTISSCTITVNKANSQNNFSATTNIGVSSAQSVASTAATTLSNTLAMGDCSNGIEVIVEMDCGAVTTKNFYANDWQAHIGSYLTACAVPRFVDDLMAAMRYFEKSYDYGTAPGTAAILAGEVVQYSTNANHVYLNCSFKVPKIVIPSVTIYSPNTGSSGKMYDGVAAADVSASTGALGLSSMIIQNVSTINSGDVFDAQWTVDARL